MLVIVMGNCFAILFNSTVFRLKKKKMGMMTFWINVFSKKKKKKKKKEVQEWKEKKKKKN